MTKELRRLSFVMLAMFTALFISTSWIQVVQADALQQNPNNRRALYDSFEVQRGTIIAGNDVIATSVKTNDLYSWTRKYTDARMWAPVTGYINPVLQSSTGLEQDMNASLSGTASAQFFSRIERLFTGQPARGSNVLLSLDPVIQKAAYDALGDLQGAVIVTEPATGRVLAMVTSPSYDTNLLASHDTVAVNKSFKTLSEDPLQPLINRTLGGTMNPPGSTFKLVVASAALASGKFTPTSEFDNKSSFTLPESSSKIYNHDGGTCGPGDKATIATALRLSCNIPMAELALKLGDDAIRAQAEKFGFGQSFSLPLVSTPSSYPANPNAPQTALSGFGQGDVTATPLQMAMVTAGIANGGVVMNPRMVDSVVGSDLTVQQTFADSEFGRALTPEVAKQMTTMMIANVNNGAASGARIDGVDVAGKTGTAEHGPGEPYTLWFTGFAPAEHPKAVVTVMVENGGGMGQAGTSSGIAAPLARKVMEAVLNK